MAWAAADDEPEIVGDIALVTDDADAPQRVLAFGLWLDPEAAQAMEGRGRTACASAARNSP